jgi:hypothetical protein
VRPARRLGSRRGTLAPQEDERQRSTRPQRLSLPFENGRHPARESLLPIWTNHIFQRDELQAFFSHVSVAPVAAVDEMPRAPEPEIAKAARGFAQDWIADATHEELQNLIASHPVIPKELDVQLLQHIESFCGSLMGRDIDRKTARKGFGDIVCSKTISS